MQLRDMVFIEDVGFLIPITLRHVIVPCAVPSLAPPRLHSICAAILQRYHRGLGKTIIKSWFAYGKGRACDGR